MKLDLSGKSVEIGLRASSAKGRVPNAELVQGARLRFGTHVAASGHDAVSDDHPRVGSTQWMPDAWSQDGSCPRGLNPMPASAGLFEVGARNAPAEESMKKEEKFVRRRTER